MIKYYSKLCMKGQIVFLIRSGGDKIKTPEAVFHDMFGTHLHDLHVLQTMTSHGGQWSRRNELNSVYVQRSKQPQVLFKPIYFIYASKMAHSLLTKSLGNVEPTATTRPAFSGVRKRTFTEEFLNYFTTGKAAHSYSSDPLQLQFALKKTRDLSSEDRDSEKLLKAGTKNWEKWNGKEWVSTDDVLSELSISF